MNSEITEVLGPWSGGIVITMMLVGFLVVVVLIWQIFKTLQTWLTSRADVARAKDYRRLAERAVNVEEKLAESQEHIAHDLAEVRSSVSDVERLLSAVE